MAKLIKIYFCGKDWNQSNITNFPYREEITKYANIKIDSDADIIFAKESTSSMSEFYKLRKPTQIKVFSATEAFTPNFNEFDFAMGFDPLNYGERYIRRNTLHRFKEFFDYKEIFNPTSDKNLFKSRKAASFIYSNPRANPNRDLFYRLLKSKIEIDSLGDHLQTTKIRTKSKNWRESKIEIEKNYRFSIAIENAFHVGYTSEKIITAFLAGAIPLYWGNIEIEKDFNSERFINLHKFQNLEEAADYVNDLEKDIDKQESILEKPILTHRQIENYSSFELEYSKFFENIIQKCQDGKYFAPVGTFQEKMIRTRRYSYAFERSLFFALRVKNWILKISNYQNLPRL